VPVIRDYRFSVLYIHFVFGVCWPWRRWGIYANFRGSSARSAASDTLAAVIQREFPGKNFRVGVDHWLVSANGTAQEISGKLGIATGQIGQAVVYNVGGYFGYAPQTTWEWIKSNMTTGALPLG
jgi:hypothetical protein